jgi:hypothetical protein
MGLFSFISDISKKYFMKMKICVDFSRIFHYYSGIKHVINITNMEVGERNDENDSIQYSEVFNS